MLWAASTNHLQPVGRRTEHQPQQRRPTGNQAATAPPLPGRRRLLSVAAPLLFLPWRGCDQGGSYATGLSSNCQPIYQPAAAAEKRFMIKQQQQQAEQQQGIPEAPAPTDPDVATQPTASGREELRSLLKEQQAYERAVLEAEQQQRTKELVDSMWMSLE